MADESSTPAPRGGRNSGNRDGGGFRIRLSDNEMRSARSIQEAFRLRSTVAVLGFSVRTIAQLLEEGKLNELVAQQQAQAGARPEGDRPGAGRSDGRSGRQTARIDPFARPARPAVRAAVEPAPAEADPGSETEVEQPAPLDPQPAGDSQPAEVAADAAGPTDTAGER
jgi:hypothetical protein